MDSFQNANEIIIKNSNSTPLINSPRLSKKTLVTKDDIPDSKLLENLDEKVIKKVVRTPRLSSAINKVLGDNIIYISANVGEKEIAICIQERSSKDTHVSTLQLAKYEFQSKTISKDIKKGNKKMINKVTIPDYREVYKEIQDIQQRFPNVDYIIVQRLNVHNKSSYSLESVFIAFCQLLYSNSHIYIDPFDLKYKIFDYKETKKSDKKVWAFNKIKELIDKYRDSDALELLKMITEPSIFDAYIQLEAVILHYGI